MDSKLSKCYARLDEEVQKRAIKIPWLYGLPKKDVTDITLVLDRIKDGKYSELSSKRIAEILVEEFGLKTSVATLRKYISSLRTADKNGK